MSTASTASTASPAHSSPADREPEPSQGGTGGRPGRWLAIAIFAAIGLYGASWAPALVFYWTFQRLVTTGELGLRSGELLETRTRDYTPGDAVDSAGAGGDWVRVEFGAAVVTLPPGGAVLESGEEERSLVARYGNGKVVVDVFQPDLMRAMLVEEVRSTGGKVEDVPRVWWTLDQGTLLRRVTDTTPADYSPRMSGAERSLYAALLCCKLRLWEADRVDRAYFLSGRDASGVFMSDPGGRAKAMVASPLGFFVFTIEGLPSAEVEPLQRWIEITATSG